VLNPLNRYPRLLSRLVERWKTYFILATAILLQLTHGMTVSADTQSQTVQGQRPNIVLILLDDVGFGATSTFGGAIATPTLDALAEEGLRFNRFHTTAICSPTRASLLTGRDSHAANVGAVLNSASAVPGYQGMIQADTATLPQILHKHGYATGAFGKWHLAPPWETTPEGPFDRWPTGLGFDEFYGFLGGETDQFEPTLYRGTQPIFRPEGNDYHVTEDIVDQSISWIEQTRTADAQKPFLLYLAPGATHAPLQVPTSWIEQYKGHFSGGWDTLREQILARQIQLGVVPEGTQLTPRPDQLPAWESLSTDQKAVAERLMETYAGFLAHTDHHIGRLVQALKDQGEFDNTLFVYIAGDNGSSAEGGVAGSINYMGALQGLSDPLAMQVAALDRIGDESTYPQYPAGWAWALTSPFQWVKQVASHLGGTRVGAVITWPAVIREHAGEIRSQFTHVNDIAPTVLAALNIDTPQAFNGVAQKPMDGRSFLQALQSKAAPEHKATQLFEVNGNRAIYHDGWMASAFHQRLPWSVGVRVKASAMSDDTWELYNLNEDFSQSNDLADKKPAKLKELQAVFRARAQALGIYPIQSAMDTMFSLPAPNLGKDVNEVVYPQPVIGITENQTVNIFNKSWHLKATIEGDSPSGVIATMGGVAAGWSLYLDEQSRAVFEYKTFELASVALRSKKPVSGTSEIEIRFDYDGGGWAKGGEFSLRVNQEVAASERILVTPPAYFSIDETFDMGMDTGSAAGAYPEGAPQGFPFSAGTLRNIVLSLKKPVDC